MTQYYPLLASLNQISQEVTHFDTTLAEARLTVEFLRVYGHHGFKTHCVKKGALIYISTSPFPDDMGRHTRSHSRSNGSAIGLFGKIPDGSATGHLEPDSQEARSHPCSNMLLISPFF
jgi:hypothetical protein